MDKDEVFKGQITEAKDFKFGEKVASVFDDMVSRSVPFYNEIQRMVAELAADNALEGTEVYDLGCSTGTTMIGMNSMINENIKFVGIDDSKEMLVKCDQKLKEKNFTRPYDLRCEDLNVSVEVSNASVVVLCLTLQFIRPVHRERLMKQIYDGMVKNGVLIIVEKILAEDSTFNRNFIKHYYDYKRRNNYSELEISQKREALENVLVPYKHSENEFLLKNTGFSHLEPFFKWYNFTGLIAVK